MSDTTKTTLVVASFIMSCISMFYAMTGQMELERSHGNIIRDTALTIDKMKDEQKSKNEAFAEFSKYFGERVMEISGKVAVLEAKSIVRGE